MNSYASKLNLLHDFQHYQTYKQKIKGKRASNKKTNKKKIAKKQKIKKRKKGNNNNNNKKIQLILKSMS